MTQLRDQVAYPTRADRNAARSGSLSKLVQAWRRNALAKALNRDGMTKRQYQQATWQMSQRRGRIA